MKMRSFSVLCMVIVSALMISACGGGGNVTSTPETPSGSNSSTSKETNTPSSNEQPQEEKVKLIIADAFPQGHTIYDAVHDSFIPALEKSGKIEVQYFPASQLGEIEDMIEAVKGGIADIAYVAPGVIPGSMPLTNMLSLPGEFDSGKDLAEVFMEMKEGILSEEYEKLGIKVIQASGTPPYQIFTSEKMVRVPDDAKGLKLRGGGGDADDFLRAYGVNIINMPSSQMYESIQRGVLDGALYLHASGLSQHLEEVTYYSTKNAPLMNLLSAYFMSLEKWNSLSPEIQQIISDAGYEFAIYQGELYDKQEQENMQTFIDNDGEVVELTDEEVQLWHDISEDAAENFIAKMEGRGFNNVRAAYDELQKIKAEVLK